MDMHLTTEQRRQFDEQGYVLLSGLIALEIAAAGAAALWRELGATPEDRATWQNIPVASGHKDPALLACFTPEFAAAAAILSGEDVAAFKGPSSVFTLNIFPQEGPWGHHSPHIDHALPRDGFRVFPRPMRVASIAYLNDVPPHGAPTVVWPGSHRKIEALAKSDPVHYELMQTLNQELNKLDLGEPVAIPSKCGDVLFYHYLCAHSGSRNASDTPRFALVHKW